MLYAMLVLFLLVYMASMLLAPPIDLQHAQLFIEDGYGLVGAVNNASGYLAGATTMVVDNFGANVAVATGDTFTLTGDPTVYTITAHVETSGSTTSITFTPGLVNPVTDDEVITVGPHMLEIRIGEGNLTYNERQQFVYVKNHNKLDTVKFGEEQTIEVSFDFVWDHLKGQTADPPTIEEALKNYGNAANWKTTATDPCQPYALNLRLLHTPVCPNVYLEEVILPDYRWEELNHNLRDASVASRGQSHRTKATVNRIAAA